MTNTSWTPNTWQATISEDEIEVHDATCDALYLYVRPDNGQVLSKRDAHLIAAAPDLYEALEALMASDGARGTYDAFKAYDAKQSAERALAKARGESPPPQQ